MSLLKINPDYQKRVYGLDVFRAVAIILVVIGHGSFLVNYFAPGFPYLKFIDGVELFFVLSGFLIGSILIKILEENNEFKVLKSLTGFWKRRWYRTLPNYYLILLVNYLLVRFDIINGDITQFNWKFLLFLHNFSGPFVDFFWESWSLSIEEWFYISFPIALFFSLAIFNKIISVKLITIFWIIFFIVSPLIFRLSISSMEVDSFWYDVHFRKVVITRLDSIMYGVLMAWIKFYYGQWFFKYRYTMFISGLVIIYAVILPEKEVASIFMKTIYFSIIGIGASLLLPFADSIKKSKTVFGKAIVHISIISYSMYLLNLGPVAQVIQKNFLPSNSLEAVFAYLIYWIVVILASTLLYKFFERPMMNLREK